jgi:hypothetical protein
LVRSSARGVGLARSYRIAGQHICDEEKERTMHTTVVEMLRATPKGPFIQNDALAKCIDECFGCTQTCVACADACLGEDNVKMLAKCIRLNLDCADICENTGRLLSRQQQPDLELLRRGLELCGLACRKCAEECERHAPKHEHCRICAQSCRSCLRACEQLLTVFTVSPV